MAIRRQEYGLFAETIDTAVGEFRGIHTWAI
jgi:tRNA A37 threonylcarbamoyltransferase TsaD